MLIYEKENKLNINFDNEVSEQPDLQISKEDGKTSVKIDGQESGGGSGGGVLIVHDNDGTLDKTMGEIQTAFLAGKTVYSLAERIGEYSMIISVTPVRHGPEAYSGSASIDGKIRYSVREETEEAALAAYPTAQ